MPKYICRKCGTECYGRILHTLKACHVCAEPIHREDVRDVDTDPLSASSASVMPHHGFFVLHEHTF
jgi:hypothetical protein